MVGTIRATFDGMPSLLLEAAIAVLPDDRADWGRAMQVELSHVGGSGPRWSFAIGCALTAAFPPRSSRLPTFISGVLATTGVAIAGLAVGRALPALFVFTVTFLALVGGIVTLTVARTIDALLHSPA
jgi:hypothetical protein